MLLPAADARLALPQPRRAADRLLERATSTTGSLTTFPGVSATACRSATSSFRIAPAPSARKSSASAEVDAVVELILEHAETRPEESLGVITMGIKHADRIESALLERAPRAAGPRRVLRPRPTRSGSSSRTSSASRATSATRSSSRSATARHADGRLLYRFGPLNLGGRRAAPQRRRHPREAAADARLLVRAARHGSRAARCPRRAQLLRDYLQYAESGGSNLGERALERPDAQPLRDRRPRHARARRDHRHAAVRRLAATGSTSPPSTPTSPAASSSPSSATAPATTPPRPRATATGSARSSSNASAGASTASGRRTGSTTRRHHCSELSTPSSRLSATATTPSRRRRNGGRKTSGRSRNDFADNAARAREAA